MPLDVLKKISALNMKPVASEGERFDDMDLEAEQDTLSFENMNAARFRSEMTKLSKEHRSEKADTKEKPAPTNNDLPNRPTLIFGSDFQDDTANNNPSEINEVVEEGATEVMSSPDTLFHRENRWETMDEENLPKPGDFIEQYKIISEVGRGGFGAVYEAQNTKLGRTEAIKVILPSAKSTCADIEKRFKREINIVSRLEHPNIVRLYDFGLLEHNLMWMSMELIRGEQLGILMDRERAISFARAKNIMLQVLSALQDAHEHEIVHRDLKPSNIVISKRNGYPELAMILDFGLSKAIGNAEDASVQNVTTNAAQSIYGTPNYMAPEQFSLSAIVSPTVDVYAAGIILLELLTGVPAYSGSVIEIACAQRNSPIPIPESLHGTAVETVISKACAKMPSERYQNAGEFYDALSKIQSIKDKPFILRRKAQKLPQKSESLPSNKFLAIPEDLIKDLPIIKPITFYATIVLAFLVILLGILLILK